MYNRRLDSHQLDRSATITALLHGLDEQIFGADKQVSGRGLSD